MQHPGTLSRRDFGRRCAGFAASLAALPGGRAAPAPQARRYHLSVSPDALRADPDLLATVGKAGVTDVWLAGFLYGHWPYPVDDLAAWGTKAERLGLAAHVVNVPLGHPGDSLGSSAGPIPLTPPRHWRLARRPDGSTFAGTSLHPPATAENAAALRRLAAAGFKTVFLDDDFRLAPAPGQVGGCFCPDHKERFLRHNGYPETRWSELLEAVARRTSLAPVLRRWVDFTCDELTGCFRALQAAAPDTALGVMVMVLGSEKAGIRLADYRQVPFRVGEGHFDDASFSPLKGKTDELFSSLFHRRYAAPERAYSETTAYPANRLSAANMAGKLAVSTLSDVRHTLFMSGLTAFPRGHWATLGPALKRHAAVHARVAGRVPRGPLKHFWGEYARFLGDDNPYSLFLALGLPFEVVDAPARDGFTFLGDADARAAADGLLRSEGTAFVARAAGRGVRGVAEDWPALLALKREIVPRLAGVPYVEGERPAVCAWYPDVGAAVVWNLSEGPATLVLRQGDVRRELSVAGLDVALADDLARGP